MGKLRGLIILDGPDCAGKTTLAGKLQKIATDCGAVAEIHHLGKPEKGTAWAQQSEAMMNYIRWAFTDNKVIIADRHFLSEAIYGCAYREGSEYPYAARHIDRLCHRFRALRVICSPPSDVVVETHAKMKQVRFEEYDSGMDGVATRYRDLWFGSDSSDYDGPDYIQWLTRTGGVAERLGWYHYDYTLYLGDNDTFARMMIHELGVEQELMPEELLNPDHWHFTGFPCKSSTLLIGDITTHHNPLNIPYFANDGDAVVLAQLLQTLGFEEGKLCIATINDTVMKAGMVSELANMCGRTVVMGRNAERTMLHQGIPYQGYFAAPVHGLRFPRFQQSYLNTVIRAMVG